jgi:prepilin signal peptidase PulO-like enzyme (type II secretory pathway)
LSGLLPLAEVFAGAVFTLSYLSWPEPFTSLLASLRFGTWCLALVLLLILFFYDLQWYKLPNKVIYPLWAMSGVDYLLRFIQQPTLSTALAGAAAIGVGAGVFFLLFYVSKGKWIGFGDVRLGLAIGLLIGTPLLAALTIFAASFIGVIVALPGLVTRRTHLASKLPFGPLLIIGLILVRLFGQRTVDWYLTHLLFL